MTRPPADDRPRDNRPRDDRPHNDRPRDDPPRHHRAGTAPEPGDTLDPAAMLALVEGERTRAERAMEPDVRVVYAAWGAAWLVGFLAVWAAATGRGPLPLPTAGAVLAAALVLAAVITAVHIGRRVRGVRGVSSRTGAMYGWSWFLGFATLTAVMAGASRQGLPAETVALLWPVLAGLVAGTLYLAGGALWQDRVQFGLGVWVLVASSVGALVGYPAVHLVMALFGGGGFLLAAVAVPVLQRERS
jgi:hypothetical protein